MPSLYSHSRLSSFENCKKKFYFRYVQAIPQETEGIEAFVGKRVHEILERLYQFVENEQLPSLPKVLQRYYALFDEQHDPTRVKIVKQGMDVDHYRELGARCIEHHYRRHYPFDDGETLGLEQRVVFHLDEDRQYGIQGIIDRVVRTRDGVIEIQDYKTGSYVPSQKKLDEDRQLALYQIGVSRQLETREPIRLVWHYLARGRTCTSTRTPEQLEALGRETIGLIDRIQAETDFPAQKNNLCPWCEYQDICPAFGHTPPPPEQRAGSAARPEAESEAGPRSQQLSLL